MVVINIRRICWEEKNRTFFFFGGGHGQTSKKYLKISSPFNFLYYEICKKLIANNCLKEKWEMRRKWLAFIYRDTTKKERSSIFTFSMFQMIKRCYSFSNVNFRLIAAKCIYINRRHSGIIPHFEGFKLMY